MKDFEKTKNIIIDNFGENTFCELPSHTMSSEDFHGIYKYIREFFVIWVR